MLIEHRELVGPIAEFLTEIERQFKNIGNLLDVVNVSLMTQVEDRPLFFIQKRQKIDAPIRIQA